eukprot:COSAG01_NODE_2015_length_8643_cov_8.718984_5_plen_338_part_00
MRSQQDPAVDAAALARSVLRLLPPALPPPPPLRLAGCLPGQRVRACGTFRPLPSCHRYRCCCCCCPLRGRSAWAAAASPAPATSAVAATIGTPNVSCPAWEPHVYATPGCPAALSISPPRLARRRAGPGPHLACAAAAAAHTASAPPIGACGLAPATLATRTDAGPRTSGCAVFRRGYRHLSARCARLGTSSFYQAGTQCCAPTLRCVWISMVTRRRHQVATHALPATAVLAGNTSGERPRRACLGIRPCLARGARVTAAMQRVRGSPSPAVASPVRSPLRRHRRRRRHRLRAASSATAAVGCARCPCKSTRARWRKPGAEGGSSAWSWWLPSAASM